VYYPYCKDESKLVSGELYCEKGKCNFSRNVSKNLILGQTMRLMRLRMKWLKTESSFVSFAENQ